MLRGAMGLQFKQAACVKQDGDCDICPVTRSCPYFVCFESRGLFEGNQRDVPHPYLINCRDERRNLSRGDLLIFDLVLMGNNVKSLPYFLFAFIRTGAGKGLTRRNIGFEVTGVLHRGTQIYDRETQCLREQLEPIPETVIEPQETKDLILELVTPTRIRANKRFVGKEMEPLDFLKCLYHTLEGLEPYVGCLELPEKAEFFEKSADLQIVERNLHWQPVIRHSNRQGKKIAMGGVMGSFRLQGEALKDLTPYLSLLPHINLGKNRVFGFGQVELRQ
jgi:CRISPR-associated endoribonuclease Cas6